jgi:hypothetical protein
MIRMLQNDEAAVFFKLLVGWMARYVDFTKNKPSYG